MSLAKCGETHFRQDPVIGRRLRHHRRRGTDGHVGPDRHHQRPGGCDLPQHPTVGGGQFMAEIHLREWRPGCRWQQLPRGDLPPWHHRPAVWPVMPSADGL